MSDKWQRVSEKVFWASFILVSIVILAATAGSIIVSYTAGANIVLVSDNVFKFIEHILWVFATPVTVRLAGDRLPDVVNLVMALRGVTITNPKRDENGINQENNN